VSHILCVLQRKQIPAQKMDDKTQRPLKNKSTAKDQIYRLLLSKSIAYQNMKMATEKIAKKKDTCKHTHQMKLRRPQKPLFADNEI
jgi:hypothetical protein